jgi:hypothetical protein
MTGYNFGQGGFRFKNNPAKFAYLCEQNTSCWGWEKTNYRNSKI